jgi:hypothetical protein
MTATPEQVGLYALPDRGRRGRARRSAGRGRPRALHGHPVALSAVPTTLRQLCTDAGPDLLQVAIAPKGLEVTVTDVRMHDPLDPPAMATRPGQVLLAIGAAGDDERTCELLADAAARRAVAVVCKRRGPVPDRLVAAGDAAGVALLTTDAVVDWNELYDLLRTAIAVDEDSELRRRTARGRLSDLVDAVAAATASAVRIEDVHGRVLAFSQTDAAAASSDTTLRAARTAEDWPDELRRHGVLARLLAADGPVAVDLPSSPACWAIPVRAGGTTLGSVWLAGDAASEGEADAVLREAAALAALQLLRDGVADDLERRVRAGMLQKLLTGRAISDSEVERLGLASAAAFVVAAIEAVPGSSKPASVQDRLVDLAILHLRAYRCTAAVTVMDDRCYVVAAVADDAGRDALRRTLQDFVTRASSSLHVDLRVGLGKRVASCQDVVDARRGADRCVELGDEPNRVVAYEDVHRRALLADVEQFLTEQGTPISQELALLRDHDRDRGSDYLPTLRAFLDALGDAGTAAALLDIHVNTFRYRMRRIAEIAGTDFGDADARFALELELRRLAASPAT